MPSLEGQEARENPTVVYVDRDSNATATRAQEFRVFHEDLVLSCQERLEAYETPLSIHELRLLGDDPPLRIPVGDAAEMIAALRATSDDATFEATMRATLGLTW